MLTLHIYEMLQKMKDKNILTNYMPAASCFTSSGIQNLL
jgi:hypothetical protein